MKTPEEMAEDYANESGWLHGDYVWVEAHGGFLAGYQAREQAEKIELAERYGHGSPLQKIAAEYVKRRGTAGPLALMEENRFIDGYHAGQEAVQTQLAVGEDVVRELLNAPKWISVKDRLPRPGQEVLAFDNGIMRVQAISDHGAWHPYVNGARCNPSHWMELPASPEDSKT